MAGIVSSYYTEVHWD